MQIKKTINNYYFKNEERITKRFDQGVAIEWPLNYSPRCLEYVWLL